MSLNARKILIVEDDPTILLSLEFLMKKNGYEVFVARDGLEALQIIDEQEPLDVVLLDIMMPELDGYAVCKYIRTEKQQADTKIIFLSAKNRESDIEKGYQVGADLYIPKPFSTRELLKTIKSFGTSKE